MTRKFALGAVSLVAAAGFVLGVSAGAAEAGKKAKAMMFPKNISLVSGVVTFEEVSGGVIVNANLIGVPFGKHGFHIHAKGDCSSFDGKSAGGHFNPLKKRHGGPNAASHHAGDLGNVETNAFGVVNFKRQYKGITISSGPTSIAGRAVILHILPDDLKSQPTGAAGDRIACGVIGIVQD